MHVGLVVEDATEPVLTGLLVSLVEVSLDSFRYLRKGGGTVVRFKMCDCNVGACLAMD